MARKLLYGNEIVSFTINTTPTTKTGTLIVKGIIPAEKVLIINDVTNNTSIYTFSDPLNTITCTPSYTEKQTTITIASLPEATTTSSDLELFIEREEVEIKPSRTYRDPVSKFRVSQGESIIDTDFEYGLQPTKWETLRTVNNIPTYYSSIFSEDAISAVSIKVETGNVATKVNDKVTVTTSTAHNLVKGSIIEITGLTDIKYEGVYIVSDVSTTTFSYKTSFVSGVNQNNIQTIYTLIYPGSFYTGSGIELADIQVISGAASTLTVITPNKHTIRDSTKVYLKQSRATKTFEFVSSSNPVTTDVVGFGTTTKSALINPSFVNTGTNQSAYYANLPIITDDWIGDFEVNFPSTSVTTGPTAKISYDLADQLGEAANTPLKVGDIFTIYSPRDNNSISMDALSGSPAGSISGSASFKAFQVVGTGYTFNGTGDPGVGIVTFSLTSLYTGSSQQGIISVGSTTYGKHRLIKGVRITQVNAYNGTLGSTAMYYELQANQPTFPYAVGDKLVFVSNTTLSQLLVSTFNDYAPTNYSVHTITEVNTASKYIRVSNNPFGNAFNQGGTIDVKTNRFVAGFKINEIPLRNSIYLPPRAGFSTTPFVDADFVTYNGTGNSNAIPYIVPAGTNATYANNAYRLTNNQLLNLRSITGYPNWYRLHPITDNALASFYNIVLPPGNVLDTFYTNTHTFENTSPRIDQNTIRLKDQPKFSDNQEFLYSARAGSTAIGGLTDPTYIAKSNDPKIENRFRVQKTTTPASYPVSFVEYPWQGNKNYMRLIIGPGSSVAPAIFNGRNVHTAGIVPGAYIQVTGVPAGAVGQAGAGQPNGAAVEKFVNQIFRVSTITSGGQANNAGIDSSVAANYNVTVLVCEVPQGANSGFNTSLSYFWKGWSNLSQAIPGSSVCGIQTFSSVGVGTQVASLNAIGVADDIYSVTSGSVGAGNSFVFNTSFEVPQITLSAVGGANTIGINTIPAWIRLPKHLLADGAKVNYTATNPSNPIGQLTSGTDYFVRVLDGDHIGLTLTNESATNRTDNASLINFNSVGAGNTHQFTTNSAKGFIIGNGNPNAPYNDYVGFSTDSNIITGFNNTTFLSDFANGDIFRIYQSKPWSGTTGSTLVGPGTYFESKIISVKSNNTLQIEDFITSNDLSVPAAGVGTGYYLVPTRAYLLTDAKAVHRPYDGGVSMTSGVTPNSQIIRQTRRYFRYQSGKGIQCSMAVNFNPTYDVEFITPVGIGSTAKITSKFPHGINATYTANPLDPLNNQQVKISTFDIDKNVIVSPYNSTFNIEKVTNDFEFEINFPNNQTAPSVDSVGFFQYNVLNWRDSALRAGMFDDQNGFFFKYDGETVYAVRRSSTQQLSGSCTIIRNSHTISGQNTKFLKQLSINDNVVIRGQTYKVVNIVNNVTIEVQPAYRGQDSDNVLISKTIDTEIPQSEWSIDRCDGTGPSGYKLDVNRIQMIYMDYSWYGAGSIRFGFKNQDGEVMYVHEFLHNNDFTESYFRSGNLPARYEVQTGDNPGFGPSLFHWGSSVIMDGRFDDDKAYLFTADSTALPFTNGGLSSNVDGVISASDLTKMTGINAAEASSAAVGMEITNPNAANIFQNKTKISGIEIDPATPKFSDGKYLFVLDKPAKAATAGITFNLTSGTAAQLRSFIPLVSIRLAPSVDNGTTGNLGYRDIITRMQLTLKSAGLLTTHDCEVRLYLNPRLSKDNWRSVGSPSLAQIYRHEVGDTFSGGTVIYSFRAQGGGVTNTTTGRRSLNVTSVSLDELALLGNSILGGDGVFPDGPDVLTVAIRPVDTSGISGASPLIATSRISWAEAQA